MLAETPTNPIDGMLDAVSACFDRSGAEALLRLRAPESVQQRMEVLADRCTEGLLTSEERDEYEQLIRVGNFISILQARARRQLAAGQAA